MFNLPFYVIRILSAAILFLMALYAADKFTEFSVFNISELIPWNLLVIPMFVLILLMPTPEKMRDIIRAKEHKKKSGADISWRDEPPFGEYLHKRFLEMNGLLSKVASGSLELRQFISEYNDFYYYEALDGHEASRDQSKILEELTPLVALHKDVQEKVLNLIYFNDDNSYKGEMRDRISSVEALKRLKEVCERHDIEKLNGLIVSKL